MVLGQQVVQEVLGSSRGGNLGSSEAVEWRAGSRRGRLGSGQAVVLAGTMVDRLGRHLGTEHSYSSCELASRLGKNLGGVGDILANIGPRTHSIQVRLRPGRSQTGRVGQNLFLEKSFSWQSCTKNNLLLEFYYHLNFINVY